MPTISPSPRTTPTSTAGKSSSQSTPVATPPPTPRASESTLPQLARGARGEDVTRAQRRLQAHGFGKQLGNAGADGDYGPATERAVKDFQRARGLSVDGVVGPQTWAALNDNPVSTMPPDVIGAQPNSAPSKGPMPPTESPAPKKGLGRAKRPTLQRGSEGAAVRELQNKLNTLGYGAGSVDGQFGPTTEGAVKRFQTAEGLKADGIAGAKTWQRLNERADAKADPTPSSPQRSSSGGSGPSVGSPTTSAASPTTTSGAPASGSPMSAAARTIRTSKDQDERRSATMAGIRALENVPASQRGQAVRAGRSSLEAIGQGLAELKGDDTKKAMAALSRVGESLSDADLKSMTKAIATGYGPGLDVDGRRHDSDNKSELESGLKNAVKDGHGARMGVALSRELDAAGTQFRVGRGPGVPAGSAARRAVVAGVNDVANDYKKSQAKIAEINQRIGLVESAIGGALTGDEIKAGRSALKAEHASAYRNANQAGQHLASTLDGAGMLAKSSNADERKAGLNALGAAALEPPVEAVGRQLAEYGRAEAERPGTTPLSSIQKLNAEQQQALARNVGSSVVAAGGDAAKVLADLGGWQGGKYADAFSNAGHALSFIDGKADFADVLSAANLGLSAADSSAARRLGLHLGDDVARSFAKRLGVAGGVYDIFQGARALKRGDKADGVIGIASGLGAIAAASLGSAGLGLAVVGGALAAKVGVNMWKGLQKRLGTLGDLSSYLEGTGRYNQQESNVFSMYLMDGSGPAERGRLVGNVEDTAKLLSARTGRHVTRDELLDAMIKDPEAQSRQLLRIADEEPGSPSTEWGYAAQNEFGRFEYADNYSTFTLNGLADYLEHSGMLDRWKAEGRI